MTPRPDGITNADRSRWAQEAVEAYVVARDVPLEDVPLEDQAEDLIVDLLHLLHRGGVPVWGIDEVLGRAMDNFQDEESNEEACS